MKRVFARFLNKYRVFFPIVLIYHSLKAIRHADLVNEIKLRLFPSPDGLKFPPSRLIFKIIGHGWRSIYYTSGYLIVENLKENLESVGIKLDRFKSVMDFGCGCGRLFRHFKKFNIPHCYGTDYNPVLVKWCQKQLKFGTFGTNQLAPPIDMPAESFDFIYSRSVFTHLSEELQKKWLIELYRLLKPGGILYFTTHGEQFANGLTESETIIYKRGEVVIHNINDVGKNICISYQRPDYFRNHLKSGFKFLAFFPGQKAIHLQQDGNIFKKTADPLVFSD